MRFSKYLKDKINYILGFILYCFIIITFLKAMQIDNNVVIVIITISFVFFIIGFLVNYLRKNTYIKSIEKVMDGLQEKYLISEVMEKPKREENLAYYRILKKANKSMLENVTKVQIARKRL